MLIGMTQPPYSSSDADSTDHGSGTPGWYGSSSEQNPYESVPSYSPQDGGAGYPAGQYGPGDKYGQGGQYEQYGQDGQYGQYGQGGQYGQHPGYQGYYGASPEGQSAATTSLVLAIIGLFAFGIILGPLAIYFAGKAERLGVPATAGKVIGWIVTILWGVSILFILFAVGFGIVLSGTSSGY